MAVWRIRDVYPGSRIWFLPIPDPGSRISDPGSKNSNKRQEWKNFFVIPFFVATNFTKLNIILFLISWRKKFGPIFQELLKILPKKLSPSPQKYGFGIRDPGSGKNLIRIPDPGVKRHRIPNPRSGSATLVDGMYDVVERLGRGSAGMHQRREFLEQLLYLGRESGYGGGGLRTPGANKRSGTCLGEGAASCRTCCLAGIIESSNLARKSMTRIGVATADSKKSNSKLWPEKQTVPRRRPHAGICLPLAPTRCRPMGGAELECSRIEMDAPESTKNFKLVRESWRKIKLFVGKEDMDVADSGKEREGGGSRLG